MIKQLSWKLSFTSCVFCRHVNQIWQEKLFDFACRGIVVSATVIMVTGLVVAQRKTKNEKPRVRLVGGLKNHLLGVLIKESNYFFNKKTQMEMRKTKWMGGVLYYLKNPSKDLWERVVPQPAKKPINGKPKAKGNGKNPIRRNSQEDNQT